MLNKKLDKKDKKLLYELNCNARITNSELAKKLGLSKKGIEYRIKKLENSNVIEGYYPIIDFLRLGYYYCRGLIKLQYMNSKIKKEMEEFIGSNKNFNWSLWASGEYNLVIGEWLKTLKDFKDNINKFVIKFDKHVKKIDFSLGIKLDQFSYDFLTESKKRNLITIKETKEISKLKELDFLILKELTKNARVTILEISKKLNSNPTSIKNRIKKMHDKKILMGYKPSINLKAIDRVHFKLLLYLNYTNIDNLVHIRDFLINKENVIYLVDEIGISDLDLEILCSSSNEFFKFLNELQENFSEIIKSYEYFVFTDTIKINYLPRGLEEEF